MLRSTALIFCTVTLAPMSFTAVLDATEPANLVTNGGFENGIDGWSYGQWKGDPQPGFIDDADVVEGKACFVMGLAGVDDSRTLSTSTDIDPAKDYELRFALRGVDLPPDSVGIALLQWGTESGKKVSPQGWVWLPGRRHAKDILTTGGTFDWKRFELHIYRQGIKPTTKRVSIYFTRSSLSQGELAIDDVSLVPVAPIAYKPSRDNQAPQRSTKPAPAKQTAPQHAQTTDKPATEAPSRLLLLDRCNSADRWSLTLGSEFPGAKGAVTEEQLDGQSTLKVEFDLSQGGAYTGAETEINLQQGESLLCDVRRAGGGYFTARLRDATDQVHSGGFRAGNNQWETIELPLNKETFTSHWGGANDGKLHYPLRRLLIAASSNKKERGVFWLRNLGVKTREQAKTWRIDAATDQPGHIHFVDGSTIRLTVAVDNRLREARTAPISIRVTDLDGNTIASHQVHKHFAAWQQQTIDLPLENPGAGYFLVSVTIGAEQETEPYEAAFAVVPKPRRYRQRAADSFFAMHVSDPEVAARLGVHFSRYFHFWRYTESHPGSYSHASDFVKACLDAGIDVMMCLDYREPGWLKPKTLSNGLPTQEALRRYADWVRDSVRAHPQVAVFEIQNEPNLELGRSRNLTTQAGVEFYTQLVQVAAPIIRAEAPTAKIAGCTVSGGDYDDDFSFSRPVLEQVGGLLDIYGGHPYASPRVFGPARQSSWPADNREAEKNRAAVKLLDEFSGPKHVWIGEKGWAITESSSLGGDHAQSYAHCLAQSLIVARSIPGIEKYFWFRQTQRHGSEGGDYTLFRGDDSLQPMPGAVAYANVAWHLDHTRPAEFFPLADDVRVSVFERSASGAVAALWSTNKPFLLQPEFPADVQAFDLFGRRLPSQELSLTSAPVFIETPTLSTEELAAAIRTASLKPAQPFDVLAVTPRDVNTLEVRLANRTLSSFPVQCRIGNQSKRLILPGVSDPVRTEIHLAQPLTENAAAGPLDVILSASDVQPRTVPVRTDLVAVSRRTGIVIDGDPCDWPTAAQLQADTKEQMHPPDPAGWKGPQDFSIQASLAWDADNLYLLVRVLDDKHVADETPDQSTGDCLHIAIDPNNDAGFQSGYDATDREYGVVFDQGQTRLVRMYPGAGDDSVRAAAQRTGDATVYEMAFPWESLGQTARPGLAFSLNFAAVENDGGGRKYAMALTPGIVESKRPALFCDFYLAE